MTTEIAVFTVQPDKLTDLKAARKKAMAYVSALPGFRSESFRQSADHPHQYVDIVEWDSVDHARTAGEAVMASADCADYFGCIDQVILMDHVQPITGVDDDTN